MSKVATIKNNRGRITFQLSLAATKRYYPELKGCKYLYFGLPHNDDNDLLARIRLRELVTDLDSGKFDPFNESKYKHTETIEEIIQKKQLPTLKEIATIEWNIKLKKGIIHESSYKTIFPGYLRFLEQTSNDITDAKLLLNLIENYPTTLYKKYYFVRLIITSINWGIREERLPSYVDNVLKKLVKLRNDYVSALKKNKSCRSNKLGPINKDFAYYSEEERDIIIQSFYERKYKHNTNIAELVEFIFHTGVRTQEAYSLTWNDISINKNGEMIISINKAYSSILKKNKSTKTGEVREFKVTTKVKELIERMKLKQGNEENNLLFKNSEGKEFNIGRLNYYWYGDFHKGKENAHPGVVYSLYEERKISKYLNPYQMRASFITHQLLKGKSPLMISKWTGHDPKTLLEHYEKLTGLEESPAD